MNDRLTLSRQIGAAFVGWLYERRLNYSVGLFNGTGVNASFNDNDNFTWVGRVEAVPHQGRWGGHEVRWGIGGNGYSTHDTNLAGAPPELGFDSTPGGNADNVFSGDRTGWGVDSQFRVGSLDIWASTCKCATNRGTPFQRYSPRRTAPTFKQPASSFRDGCKLSPSGITTIRAGTVSSMRHALGRWGSTARSRATT
jgi:hypothetical protein